MIRIETTQLSNGYYQTEAHVRGKHLFTCRSLNREFTIKEVEKDCEIVKRNLR